MKDQFKPLTDEEQKNTNGGESIIPYDPVTGEPFPEENGGYGGPETETAFPKREPGMM